MQIKNLSWKFIINWKSRKILIIIYALMQSIIQTDLWHSQSINRGDSAINDLHSHIFEFIRLIHFVYRSEIRFIWQELNFN